MVSGPRTSPTTSGPPTSLSKSRGALQVDPGKSSPLSDQWEWPPRATPTTNGRSTVAPPDRRNCAFNPRCLVAVWEGARVSTIFEDRLVSRASQDRRSHRWESGCQGSTAGGETHLLRRKLRVIGSSRRLPLLPITLQGQPQERQIKECLCTRRHPHRRGWEAVKLLGNVLRRTSRKSPPVRVIHGDRRQWALKHTQTQPLEGLEKPVRSGWPHIHRGMAALLTQQPRSCFGTYSGIGPEKKRCGHPLGRICSAPRSGRILSES